MTTSVGLRQNDEQEDRKQIPCGNDKGKQATASHPFRKERGMDGAPSGNDKGKQATASHPFRKERGMDGAPSGNDKRKQATASHPFRKERGMDGAPSAMDGAPGIPPIPQRTRYGWGTQ